MHKTSIPESVSDLTSCSNKIAGFISATAIRGLKETQDLDGRNQFVLSGKALPNCCQKFRYTEALPVTQPNSNFEIIRSSSGSIHKHQTLCTSPWSCSWVFLPTQCVRVFVCMITVSESRFAVVFDHYAWSV